mgnify:CR=1 FL=1
MRTKLKDPTKPKPKKKNSNGTAYDILDEFHYHRTMPLTKMLKLNDKPKKKKLRGKDVFEGGTNKKLYVGLLLFNVRFFGRISIMIRVEIFQIFST